jgi:hypothetical protein
LRSLPTRLACAVTWKLGSRYGWTGRGVSDFLISDKTTPIQSHANDSLLEDVNADEASASEAPPTSRPDSHLPDRTSSFQTTQRLNQWLATCAETHTGCQTLRETAMPKRILEIKDAHVYLRETTATKDRYACLSHCWGAQGPSFRLQSSTHQQLASGLAFDQLPKTFRDAVSICISIGIQFLWIDALCQ